MNIIDTNIKIDPATMKLVHCKGCDRTWIDKKIPNVCPYCGAVKKNGKNNPLTKASEDECDSYMEEYGEAMAALSSTKSGSDSSVGSGDSSIDRNERPDAGGYKEDYPSADQTSSYAETTEETESETYEPIGFDPDELANNMDGERKIDKYVKRQMLSDAEQEVKETKWALQRAGLPTDAFQNILPQVKNSADHLGGYIPEYTSLLLKMVVDSTIQHELRHPRRGRTYTIDDVNDMLSEVGISEDYRESYYAVAGIAV